MMAFWYQRALMSSCLPGPHARQTVILYDGRQLKGHGELIGLLCYGGAVVGSASPPASCSARYRGSGGSADRARFASASRSLARDRAAPSAPGLLVTAAMNVSASIPSSRAGPIA